MKKLIQGIIEFRTNLSDEQRKMFAQLALGQKPDALFIACSDSRVVPNVFASTNPGDLFVLRNIGNLIPPPSTEVCDSAPAALEFALLNLSVRDIVICGHSECGAIQLLCDGVSPETQQSSLQSWLRFGQSSIERVKGGLIIDPQLSFNNQVSQVNVLEQIEHIKAYPFVQERLEKKQLRIHGWWFDIAKAEVYRYEAGKNKFVSIDDLG